MPTKFLIVVNPAANDGQSKLTWSKVQNELNHHHIPFEYRISKYKGHLKLITEQLIKNNYKTNSHYHFVIMIIGGDGSVNEVITSINNNFDNLKIPVAFIPAGHNNNFAIANHFPLDWENALNRILKCEQATNLHLGHYIDNSTHENGYFLNGLEIGLGSDYLNEQKRQSSRFKLFNWVKKWFSLIMTFYNLETFSLRIFMHEHYYQFNQSIELLIQNTSLLNNNISILKDEKIPNNKFRIIILEKKNFFSMLMNFITLMRGKKSKSKTVHYYLADHFSINDDTLKYGSIDAEVIGSKFFDLKCDLITYPFWI